MRSRPRLRLHQLEGRLAPVAGLTHFLNTADIYETGSHSARVQRYTDRLVVGVNPQTADATLAQLRDSIGLEVASTLQAGLMILTAPTAAGDSTAARYAALESQMAQATALPGVTWAAPVFHDPATPNNWMVATNEVIVSLRDGVTAQAFFGGDSRFVSWQPLPGTPDQFVATTANYGAATLQLSNVLNRDSRLTWAQPNFYQSWTTFATTNDPLLSSQWHLNNTGQRGGSNDADADVFEAWDVSPGGSSSILVSVVDDGMEFTHPDLMPNLFTNPGEIAGNSVDDDGNGYVDDVNGWDFTTNGTAGDNNPGPGGTNDRHATSVAGVTAAKGNNTLGTAGVAYNAKILPVRIFGDTGAAASDANIAAAVNYAAGRNKTGTGTWTNVHIMNNSWGGGGFSSAIQSAFAFATASGRGGKGTVSFIATGNDTASTVSFPANLAGSNAGIIAVGASTDGDVRSSYSNTGPEVTVVAPSNGGAAGIATTDRVGANGYNTSASPTGDTTLGFGGTSSATPLTAGIGALILSLDNTLTAAQVRGLLANTTDYIGPAGTVYDPQTGFNREYGFGRVNANTAVRGVGVAEIQVLSGRTELIDGTGTVNYGDVARFTTARSFVRIRNQGTATLNLSNLTITGTGFSLANGLSDSTLTVGETAWLEVAFTPTVLGTATGTLTLTSNDANEGTYDIALKGVGITPAISGTLFEDWNGDGVRNTFDKAQGSHTILFDTNGNGVQDSKTFATGTVNIGIPDANTTGITSTLAVSGVPASVLDVNVTVNITHPFVGDLEVYLTGPNNSKIALVTQRGSSGDNFTNTTFDDEASTAISSGTAPFTGSFRPEVALNTFDGTTANGNWVLTVIDPFSQDVGTLVSWSLTMLTEATTTSTATGEYSLAKIDAGTYKVTPFVAGFNAVALPTITITGPTDTFTADLGVGRQNAFYGFAIDDTNSNGSFDTGELGLNGVQIYIDTNGNGSFTAGEPTVTTDALGRYQFLSQPTGAATLRQVVPTGRFASFPAAGSINVTLTANGTIFGNNFGSFTNRAPAITSAATATLFENTTVVQTVTATDPDPGTTLIYTIIGGADAALFALDSGTGKLTFATAPNFETGGDNVYEVTVRAFDGSLSDSRTVTVTVQDVNEAPAFTVGANPTINEDAGAQSLVNFLTGISTGPDPEAGQTVSFAVAVVSSTGTLTFAAAPLIDTTGRLTYSPTANTNGTAKVRVIATDTGGTNNGGVDTSAAQFFTITVNAVNDAPSFTLAGNPAVDEDAGSQTVANFVTAISPGPADEAAQTVTFTVTTDVPSLFATAPAISSGGQLTYTPAANANGATTITVVGKDSGGAETTQTFTITVNAVNDAPTFTLAGNQTLDEDAGSQSIANFVTAISPGPANESSQTVSFQVSATNASLFATAPALSGGMLTFTPAADANGTSTVTVTAKDSAGGETTQTFTITVNAVNDAPTFTLAGNQTIDEDAGSQSIANFATAVSPGPADEAAQSVTLEVSATNPGLFATAPAMNAGTLSYTPAANANGTSTVTVTAKDSAGAETTQTFTITVNAVNDAPTFTLAGNQTLAEDGGSQSIANFVTAISPGPANESSQTVSFQVSATNASLFTTAPALSGGTLTFTTAADANGVSTVTVTAKDSAGAETTQTFTITVNAVNDAPTFTLAGNQTLDEDAGSQSIANFVTAVSPGPADEAAQTVTFQMSVTNTGLFAAAPSINNGTLSYTPAANANGSATVTVIAKDSGGAETTQTFTITVNAVNDVPTFTLAGNPTVSEDAGSQSIANFVTAISPGPANESSQTVSFQVSTTNAALYATAPALSGGALTYTPAANANGTSTVTVTAKDSAGAETVQTFTITVNAVNDAPTFTMGSNQKTFGDAGSQAIANFLTAISPGPADEAGQAVLFAVLADDPTMFAVLPAIDSTGRLTYTPSAIANGTATITVIATDSGGTDSAAQSFAIAVTSFANPTVTPAATSEDTLTASGLVLTTGLAGSPVTHFRFTNIRGGTLFRADGVTSVPDGSFLDVNEAGLKFRPGADANDVNTSGGFGFDVQNSTAADAAGLVGEPTAAIVTVSPVNDPPRFAVPPSVTVAEDAGLQVITAFATNVAAGSPTATDEANQPKLFTVGITSNNGLTFAQPPTVTANGVLNFRTAADSFGSATVAVTLSDGNGGTATRTFTISVTPVNDPPAATVLVPTPPVGGEGVQAVANVIAMSAGGAEADVVTTRVSVAESTGRVTFTVPPTVDATGTLRYAVARGSIGTAKLAVVANDGQADSPPVFVTVTVDAIGPVQLIGHPQFAVGADAGRGEAMLLNADRSVRFTVPGTAEGVRTAAADFTGDGIADLVLASGPGRPTSVRILDGDTQAVIFETQPFEAAFTGGLFVSAGDVNGDRRADLVITPDEGGGPRVRVFSGADFTQIADFFGIDDPNFRGGARSAVGDLSGDGTSDLIVVAGFGGGPRVAGFDGKSLGSTRVKLFNDFFAFEQALRNGIYVAVGDVDGDGFGELIAGGGPGGGPRVTAFDGRELMVGNATRPALANFFAGDVANRGGVRVGVKDLDGDNRADVIVGAGTGAGSRVTAYLGSELITNGSPASTFAFDAFDNFTGGVFVG